MHKSKTIRKAVFPAAGLGTRFLPATKASPKEMLPIVDKPLVQYAVEEAAAAGITHMIFVTGRTKRALEDHFDTAYELEAELARQEKHTLLALARDTAPKGVTFSYIRQNEPLGLGHAVLCAEPLVGSEPFAVLLPDDLMVSESGTPNATAQLVQAYTQHGSSAIAVQNVDRQAVKQYGIVATKGALANDERCETITAIVEKPSPENAPSTLAVMGRYVLSPNIFTALKNIERGAGGELQLTDAIALLLKTERVLAQHFMGTRYDCGAKLGYLQATVEMALCHPELGQAFSGYLRKKYSGLA